MPRGRDARALGYSRSAGRSRHQRDQGINGTNGTNGTNGIDGKDGAAGPAGPPGPAGAACLPTDPACVGPQGETGPQGPQGAQGDTGARGPAGPGGATFFALVATDALDGAGVLSANNQLITATRLRAGSYRVRFPFTIEFCTTVVTLSGRGGFDSGLFEHAATSVFYAPSFIGGATHWESLDFSVRVYGGSTPIQGALADGLRLNIIVHC